MIKFGDVVYLHETARLMVVRKAGPVWTLCWWHDDNEKHVDNFPTRLLRKKPRHRPT